MGKAQEIYESELLDVIHRYREKQRTSFTVAAKKASNIIDKNLGKPPRVIGSLLTESEWQKTLTRNKSWFERLQDWACR